MQSAMCKPTVFHYELGFLKLTWHNCLARKGLTSEIVRTTLLQYFKARRTVKLW